MIINGLDLGWGGLTTGPTAGQSITTVQVGGGSSIAYSQGSRIQQRSIAEVYVQAFSAIGGNAALSQAATQLLVQQLVELAGNKDMQPVLIQWTSGGGFTVPNKWDGWWLLEEVEPLDFRYIHHVPVRIAATYVAPLPPGGVAQSYSGGALATNFSGGAQLAIAYPFAAANQAATAVSRTGGEGAIPLSIAPSASFNPLVFTPSATVANWFLGGCHVYDTMSAGGNAVPTNGSFTNANWVEVFGPAHDFAGDCVVTNGLLLLGFPAGVANVCTVYLWSTAQTTPGWLSAGTLVYNDNAGNVATLRSYTLQRVGINEVRLLTRSSTSAGNWAEVRLRLQAGMAFARTDFKPLTQANTNLNGLSLVAANTLKIVSSSTSASDASGAVATDTLGVPTDYGYSVGYTNNTAQPFLLGLLYRNQPGTHLPNIVAASATQGIGDSAVPTQNAVGNYGFYAIPVGTSSTTTDKLQGEAESGTLGSGWVSVVDAAGSAGHAAKMPSGTVGGGSDFFGTAFVPAAGTWNVFVRVKVTSAAGSAAEMKLGLWDSTSSAIVASTTYKANQASTSYVWLLACAGVTPTAGHNMQFFAAPTATPGTDWFIDEAALVPVTLSAANTGPQEIFQQFLEDISTKMVRF